jgi:hypothetical protein
VPLPLLVKSGSGKLNDGAGNAGAPGKFVRGGLTNLSADHRGYSLTSGARSFSFDGNLKLVLLFNRYFDTIAAGISVPNPKYFLN